MTNEQVPDRLVFIVTPFGLFCPLSGRAGFFGALLGQAGATLVKGRWGEDRQTDRRAKSRIDGQGGVTFLSDKIAHLYFSALKKREKNQLVAPQIIGAICVSA